MLLNLVSAVLIGAIIGAMALIKKPRTKALVYSLPFPITIALIATHGKVDESNIIGLFLLSGFLWLVYWLYTKGFSIYLADIISAALYVLIGYFLIKTMPTGFVLLTILYLAFWFLFVLLYRKHEEEEVKHRPHKIKPLYKTVIVTPLAFLLLALKSQLAGIVVTFPFSGVFAVVEGQYILRTLAAIFTRNSIAILALFVTIYCTVDAIGFWYSIVAGWISYIAILLFVSKYFDVHESNGDSQR
ncbi:hypothetical protein KC951_01380 [Candidatus Saccharibacteria bacterium]|nr:hypothetical protein [Candidatus Saccharibacteria bacterium]